MDSFEPVDIDHDKIRDEDYKWDDNVIKNLEITKNDLILNSTPENRL